MSHGYGSYAVENARRLERARQAALSSSRDLAHELSKLLKSAEFHLGTEDESQLIGNLLEALPGEEASTVVLEEWNYKTRSTLERVENEILELRQLRWTEDLSAHLIVVAGSGERARKFDGKNKEADSVPAARSKIDVQIVEDRIDQRVTSVVSILDPEASDDDRAELERMSLDVMTASGGDIETQLTELKASVGRINIDVRRRALHRDRAAKLLTQLADLVGNEVEDLRQLLNKVIAGKSELLGVDEERVAGVRARAIVAEDRNLVARELTRAFAENGYDVSYEFEKDLAAGREAYAFADGDTRHAAEIQIGTSQFSFRLVHSSQDADRGRDIALEKALCKTVGLATAMAHSRGADFEVDEHHQPGSEPIAYVRRAAELWQGRRSAPYAFKEREH